MAIVEERKMSEKIFLFIFAISLAIAGIIIIPNARTAYRSVFTYCVMSRDYSINS